jgi:micrococcal nuclease
MKSNKISARVMRVLDGDTLEMAIKVRLAGIDAPETKGIEKPIGLKTKEWLTERIQGKSVQLEIKGVDVYHRLLANVYDGDSNINDELLENKLVEVYKPENHNNGKLDV